MRVVEVEIIFILILSCEFKTFIFIAAMLIIIITESIACNCLGLCKVIIEDRCTYLDSLIKDVVL